MVIYASVDESCPPRYSPDKPKTQVLAGRPFYHWADREGAGGHTVSGDFFCTMYREKTFTIAAVVQSYRYDEHVTEDFMKHVKARCEKIDALLMQVLETLVLMDPIQ